MRTFVVGTFISVLLLCASAHAQAWIQDDGRVVRIGNSFVSVSFDRSSPQLTALKGSLMGHGPAGYGADAFANNAAADPLSLQRKGFVLESSIVGGQTFASSAGAASDLKVTILTNTTAYAEFQVENVVDSVARPRVIETWKISVREKSRYIGLATTGRLTAAASDLSSVRHSLYFSSPSLYALYDDRGVVQMMSNPNAALGSRTPMSRFYAVGSGAAADVRRHEMPSNLSLVLADTKFFGAGLAGIVLAGSLPSEDIWSDGDPWKNVPAAHASSSFTWSSDWELAGVDGNFPVHVIAAALDDNIPEQDLRAILTGIYPSAVGCLASYGRDTPGQIAPTIHHPVPSYTSLYNFFDPDNYISIASMMYSGDPYLQNECRKILERTLSFVKPDGQLPHHLIINVPTYVAISGATQTGPNIFWSLAALQYVKCSGDSEWLKTFLPKLRLVVNFLFTLWDEKMGLLNVPGPLWIDVFIRNGFTTDSNAAFVMLLREFAEVESFVGNTTEGARLRAVAERISVSMNAQLWSNSSNDHFVTQKNPDGSTRDFVDYDSNLLAVASGVAGSRANAVLKRVDSGKCTHAGRATYVSEIYYGDKDCYNGNTGDSAVTMGRIMWADAHARRVTGDLQTFNNVILEPLIGDLLKDTWLNERFDCEGKPAHNPMYFEYPSTVAMLLREIRYGIQLGVGTVRLVPFGVEAFTYHIGTVHVKYSNTQVAFVSLPGAGPRTFEVQGLQTSSHFIIQTSGVADVCKHNAQKITSDSVGTLVFDDFVECSIVVTLTQ